MQTEVLKYTELMITKLCHDLSGSLSAISNGLELMNDDTAQEIQDESLKLVSQSAKDAITKLVFFRQVFGSSASDTTISYGSIQQMCDAFFAIRNIPVQWNLPVDEQIEFPAVQAKMIMAFLCVISDGLIKNGTLKLEAVGADVRLTGAAEMTKFPEANKHILQEMSQESNLDDDLSVKNVAVFYLKMLLFRENVTFSLIEEPSQITITLEGFSNSFT